MSCEGDEVDKGWERKNMKSECLQYGAASGNLVDSKTDGCINMASKVFGPEDVLSISVPRVRGRMGVVKTHMLQVREAGLLALVEQEASRGHRKVKLVVAV